LYFQAGCWSPQSHNTVSQAHGFWSWQVQTPWQESSNVLMQSFSGAWACSDVEGQRFENHYLFNDKLVHLVDEVF